MKHRPLTVLEWIILLLFMSAGITILTYIELKDRNQKEQYFINQHENLKP